MADDKTNEETKAVETEVKTPAVDETELEELRQKAQLADKWDVMKERAAEKGYDLDNADDYEEFIESFNDETPAVTTTVPAKKVEVTTKPAAPAKTEGPDKSDQAHAMSRNAILTSLYTEFKVNQSMLSEEERTKYTKKELQATFNDAPDMIVRIAKKKFDDNVYAAAAYVKKLEDGEEGIRKEGADAEKALEKGKQTAATETGRAVIEEKAKTEEDLQKEAADLIAPDDDYKYHGGE